MSDSRFGPVKYSIVVPAKDEDAAILAKLRHDFAMLPKRAGFELLIVDDGSKVPIVGATVRHPKPQGYGTALKGGIYHAKGDWIITMDGDGQHRIRDAVRLTEFIEEFPNNMMVIGDRRLVESTCIRWMGRKILNTFAGMFAWKWIPDLNSGMRIFKKEVAMGYSTILSGGFSFTTSLTLSMMTDGYKVDWLPIKVFPRPAGVSQVRLWTDGWRTLWLILWIGIGLRTRRLRGFLRSNPATKWAVNLLRGPIGKLAPRARAADDNWKITKSI